MKRIEILQIGLLLAVAPVTVGHAQQATAMVSANPVMPPAEEVLREIDDPALGDRWLLVRNPQNPAGPGRLLRFHDEGAGGLANRNEELAAVVAEAQALALPLVSLPVVRPALPVIKNGDRIVVEEHTAVADMRLSAVALGPAAVGGSFYARLEVGGRVMRVEALGAGRAILPAAREATR